LVRLRGPPHQPAAHLRRTLSDRQAASEQVDTLHPQRSHLTLPEATEAQYKDQHAVLGADLRDRILRRTVSQAMQFFDGQETLSQPSLPVVGVPQ
jgi:hypothetical protein